MRRLWLLICVAVLSAGSVAYAQPRVITNPEFLRQPEGRDFVENYPDAALAQAVQGMAIIECYVELDTTTTCEVTAETPTNWGFGEAALAISRTFRVRPAAVNGVPTREGRIRRTIRFMLPPEGIQKDWSEEERAFYAAHPPPDLPDWDDAPSFDVVQRVYPAAARVAQTEGRALLSCTVRNDRRLSCEPDTETPADQGFGAAALDLARYFRVAASDTDFIARYRRAPFVLPIFFGSDPTETPVSRDFLGVAPMEGPPFRPPLAVYPEAARAAGVNGRVVALCTLRVEPPASCVIETETPAGYGLADFIQQTLDRMPIASSEPGLLPNDQVRFEFLFDQN